MFFLTARIMRVVSQAVFIRYKYSSDDVEVTARYSLCGQCCRLDAPSEVTGRMFRHKTRIHFETNTNILLQVSGILKWDRKTSLSLIPKSRAGKWSHFGVTSGQFKLALFPSQERRDGA